jgi:hypothetical protein
MASDHGAKITADAQIVHPPRCTLRQLADELLSPKPDGRAGYDASDRERIAWLYWDTCTVVGVDPLIAVAQMVHETANLSSWWSQRPRRNPAGIGVTGANDPKTGEPLGVRFPGWSWAVRAHVGRLLMYATPPSINREPLADLIRKEAAFWRRLPIEKHGKGHTIGRLASAGWATDPDYAHKLVTVANRIAAR